MNMSESARHENMLSAMGLDFQQERVMGKPANNYEIRYSEQIVGNDRNHKLAVRFDEGCGYVGINQYDANGKVSDRILLTPDQARKLVAFVGGSLGAQL